ncbi:hypothetical protein VTN77DRAFT_4468 [Rasamsonia byssochlamydoides]|uniref:uncharacterized protein n=1 Tax=Rasamsonia byssochlamydoides TaxID=89139 RepID=UPI003743F3B3
MKLWSLLAIPIAIATATPLAKRAACSGNTATDRASWCDYSTDTNYYSVTPDTGVTREYYFTIQQVTIAPDGYERIAYTVNGTIPGPTIEADWGDTVVVHVTNNLTEARNGTSIHFHGIRQYYTNQMDGVTSITQCPTAPGETITYTWRATEYGSSWYHSHIGLQAWEGVVGGIVINGPATANYDEDKGILFLSDWSHATVDELYDSVLATGPATLDNGLINGTNVYGDDDSTTQTGYRFNTSFTAGKSYRFRLVNGAIDTHFKFSIDNHTLTVIANDFVPIEPYNTTVLNIAMGQRYDIIVTADQESVAENFWMRAIPQAACSENDSTDNIKGIVYYSDSPSTPTTTGYDYTDSCDDEDLSNLVPYLALNAGEDYWSESEPVTVLQAAENVFLWYMNDTSMSVEWNNPTLLQIWNNDTTFSNTSSVIELPTANEWAYIVITTTLAVPHPIHLHGHDFYILAQGTGTYNTSDLISLTNPPRRDTAILPASGYLVVAFKTDNPGAWLMHCHIGWHTQMGLAIQFIEQYDVARSLIDYDFLESNCAAWDSYATVEDTVQAVYDDGI